MLSRDTGQSRVPAPPHIRTGINRGKLITAFRLRAGDFANSPRGPDKYQLECLVQNHGPTAIPRPVPAGQKMGPRSASARAALALFRAARRSKFRRQRAAGPRAAARVSDHVRTVTAIKVDCRTCVITGCTHGTLSNEHHKLTLRQVSLADAAAGRIIFILRGTGERGGLYQKLN